MLVRDRRDIREQQWYQMLDNIPKDLHRPSCAGVGQGEHEMHEWEKERLGKNGGTTIGTFIGQLAFGLLGDYLGRKKIYGVELLIVILCTMCTSYRVIPRHMTSFYLPTGLRNGSFLYLPSGTVCKSDGVPINDLFCVEAAVHHRGAVLLALRWECWQLLDLQTIADKMAELGGVNAVAEAEAQVRQRVVVDYVNALLATRSELGAAGVTFDDSYWAPERYVLPWAAWVAGNGASCLSSSDVVLDSIRGDVLLLRQPFIQRLRTPVPAELPPTTGPGQALTPPAAAPAPAVPAPAGPAEPPHVDRCRRRSGHDSTMPDDGLPHKRPKLPVPLTFPAELKRPSVQAAAAATATPVPQLSQTEENAVLCDHAAAAPAGLTAGDIEDLSALLATAEPSPEERELSRVLDLLTDMEPQDCSTVLGIVRLASAGRQSLLKLSRHISLNRVFGPLLLAANSSKNDGSSSKSSNGS
eukprot:m51a1_g5094 hypothetical protein (469) ;mRNA; f:273378-278673